ncbi:hypothetical protein ACIPYS_13645 [Kitasatospora sp. NPDC089913]|uniref:hypothetical protein n=1 Tax=Kitasatospora sp. NPDC089913 TaxID=3364080 RepID=UPI00380F36DB
MIGRVKRWREARAAERAARFVEESVVLEAPGDQSLWVVFEPMGSLYELPPGESLTVRFRARAEEGYGLVRKDDYVSVSAGSGWMTAWTSAGAEVDIDTGCPEFE